MLIANSRQQHLGVYGFWSLLSGELFKIVTRLVLPHPNPSPGGEGLNYPFRTDFAPNVRSSGFELYLTLILPRQTGLVLLPRFRPEHSGLWLRTLFGSCHLVLGTLYQLIAQYSVPAFIRIIGIKMKSAAFMPEFCRFYDQVSYGDHIPQLAEQEIFLLFYSSSVSSCSKSQTPHGTLRRVLVLTMPT